jgi:hypothetical protein
MGSAKRNRMKINDQIALSTIPKETKPGKFPSNFEHMITTPTKQSSGDEYYWQHQNQLQQSSLRFTAMGSRDEKKQNIASPIQLEKSAVLPQEVPKSETQFDTEFTPDEFHPNSNFTEQVSSMYAHVEDELSHLLSPNSIDNPFLTKEIVIPKKMIRTSQPTADCSSFFKNHHVYIEGNDIELTLNTKELNEHEQKELQHLIKSHLKKQGFSLKQLIVNGVKND